MVHYIYIYIYYIYIREIAQYEVCGYKFGDISDENYGVALLNDCKYGYAAKGNLLSLSLLKSSKGPNTHADMGLHTFTYSLYPHIGISLI